jgi:hypothetical protein
MQGIYFINEKLQINQLSYEESTSIQKIALMDYIEANRMMPAKLNPYQISAHYTIPHALLYDLRLHKKQFDCLLMYSHHAIEDFSNTYPARWMILKSYFDRVVTVV